MMSFRCWTCAGVLSCLLALRVGALPSVKTPLGVAEGIFAADGVERYGGIPYAQPPLGKRRFAVAELFDTPWPAGRLDARKTGAPCINNPLGDPRSMPLDADSPPSPNEDCLHLNIWRPSNSSGPHPVMVYNFGGGLCSGYAGNPYFNGSKFAIEHGIIVVTVSYRLGALGFLVSEDFDGPGNGGMNGIRDIATALKWIQRFIPHFKGDPSKVTVFGQSSGAYATCTLTVAPEAKGLFRGAILQSGPCFGGPPNRGWGPRNISYGLQIAKEVMAAVNVTSLEELRKVPAEKVQWPAYTMNDPAVAPYFSGYFEDPGFLPASADQLWAAGKVNPKSIMVGYASKDGTAAFYSVAPTMGYVVGDKNQTTAKDYEEAIRKVWGSNADAVLLQYPLSRFEGSPQKAFLQVDADSNVICPSYQLLQYAQAADIPSWAFQFAHFIPSKRSDGWGCSNGPELDVAPPRRGAYTKLFATHGDDVKFVFGNEVGPDGLGPPNNRTVCTFTPGERMLSEKIRARWASFAASGQPFAWPEYVGRAEVAPTLILSDAETDGLGIASQAGLHAADCSFWQRLWAQPSINFV
mmetsp:Transcript_81668/g.166376  ORF Transcript_81668/g.166376 Transcript_81668/m.166376 type:complete len:578 (-) Transcript_81668:186-1919(-)